MFANAGNVPATKYLFKNHYNAQLFTGKSHNNQLISETLSRQLISKTYDTSSKQTQYQPIK